MANLSLTKQQLDLLRDMNALRQEVALNYIAQGYDNGTQAYLKACENLGRNPSKNPATSASEILSYPNVSTFIDSVKLVASKSANVDAAWVLQKSIELHDRCAQASPVKDREGNPILDDSGNPVYKFEHTGVSKALELIGKHINVQAFNEKQTSEVTHKVSDTLASKLFGGSKK